MKKTSVLCLYVVVVFNLITIEAALAKTQQIKPREIKMDTNFNGVVNRVEVYDKNKVIIRVEADTSADGKMNEWVYYKNGNPDRAEKDTNGDGKPDTFLTYDDKGKTIKSETDTNGDGKIDEWVYYEKGNITKAEKDTNGDGKPDTWLAY